MKKGIVAVAVILVVALILGTGALAEIDLSGMSYEELVELKDRINKAIWESEEWQEVTVPKGEYIAGEDIPAGKWLVTYSGDDEAEILIFSSKEEYVNALSYKRYNKLENSESCTIQLDKDEFLVIKWDSISFQPFIGF